MPPGDKEPPEGMALVHGNLPIFTASEDGLLFRLSFARYRALPGHEVFPYGTPPLFAFVTIPSLRKTPLRKNPPRGSRPPLITPLSDGTQETERGHSCIQEISAPSSCVLPPPRLLRGGMDSPSDHGSNKATLPICSRDTA